MVRRRSMANTVHLYVALSALGPDLGSVPRASPSGSMAARLRRLVLWRVVRGGRCEDLGRCAQNTGVLRCAQNDRLSTGAVRMRGVLRCAQNDNSKEARRIR